MAQVELATVERGTTELTAALAAVREPIIVVDALEEGHLRTIAAALVRLGDDWLPCGSAGLAEEWANALGLGGGTGDAPAWADPGPLLAAAGSRNEVTLAQLRRGIVERRLPCLEVDPANWWDPSREEERLAREALRALRGGSDVVVTSSLAPLMPGRGQAVAELLARVVRRVARQERLGGLFVTGGDVAVAVCHALEVRALRIRQEVQPGVPGGELVGGECDGLRVVTKAGGFGDESALLDALDYLHGHPPGSAGPYSGPPASLPARGP